MLVNCLNFTV